MSYEPTGAGSLHTSRIDLDSHHDDGLSGPRNTHPHMFLQEVLTLSKDKSYMLLAK